LARKVSSRKGSEDKPRSTRSSERLARDTMPPASSRERKFRPPSSDSVPRFAGVPTLLRLPIHEDPRIVPAVDVLLSGVPFDGGTAFRPGARFGPRAVREASALARPFSAALGVDVYDELKAADGGDIAASAGDIRSALEAISARAEQITRSGAIGGYIGGDQTVTLGVLRGIHRAKHKAVSLLHIDAQSNATGKDRTPQHGNVIRLAVEEGLIRPDSALQIGLRGPYSSADDLAFALSHGFDVVGIDEVRWDLHSVVSQVRKLVHKGALYVSVDVSALDPAAAPGTSFPLPGGMSTWELQQLLRALVGAELIGFDVVEIAPSYDQSGITAITVVSILHELLAALADTRRSGRPAASSHHATTRRGRRLSP
jgi:agmatinase